MAGIKRTKALYESAAHYLRQYGPKFSKVAAVTGLNRETVAGLWHRGWRSIDGCIAIKELIHKEQLFARAAREGFGSEGLSAIAAADIIKDSITAASVGTATAELMLVNAAEKAEAAEKRAISLMAEAEKRLAEVEALSRKKIADAEAVAMATMGNAETQAKLRLADLLRRAKVDAAETLADEAQASKFGRKAALGATAIAALILKDAQLIASQLRTAMGDLSKLSPQQALRMAREMIRLVESAEKSLILALQGERLRMGQPTEVLGIATIDGGLEEKEIKLRAIQRHLEDKRAQATARAAAQGMRMVVGGVGQQPASGVPEVATPPEESK